jgi:hypothetical protein
MRHGSLPLSRADLGFTTIQVSPGGVVVENATYGVLLLNWNDVTHATYRSERCL